MWFASGPSLIRASLIEAEVEVHGFEFVSRLTAFPHRRIHYPNAAARRAISSGDTSSLCVEIVQTCPKGSSMVPLRAP